MCKLHNLNIFVPLLLYSISDNTDIFSFEQTYRMVKDLWTNYEVSDPHSVVEGDLEDFILNFCHSHWIKLMKVSEHEPCLSSIVSTDRPC